MNKVSRETNGISTSPISSACNAAWVAVRGQALDCGSRGSPNVSRAIPLGIRVFTYAHAGAAAGGKHAERHAEIDKQVQLSCWRGDCNDRAVRACIKCKR